MAFLLTDDILKVGGLPVIQRDVSLGDILALLGVVGGLFWSFVNHVIRQREFEKHRLDTEGWIETFRKRTHELGTAISAPALQVELLKRDIARVDAEILVLRTEAAKIRQRIDFVDDRVMEKLGKMERDISRVLGHLNITAP